jgi:hypothetical protein
MAEREDHLLMGDQRENYNALNNKDIKRPMESFLSHHFTPGKWRPQRSDELKIAKRREIKWHLNENWFLWIGSG